MPGLKAACERALPFSFQIKRGKFFHNRPLSDYASMAMWRTEDPGVDRSQGRKDKLAILSEEK